VKICGVRSPQDAALAVSAGADFIGMLLWQGAKRAVSISIAAQIAAEAVQRGAQPVAVFVDEDADTIVRVCSEAGISTAQLHGDGARAALPDIPPELQVIYVLHATTDGVIQTELPTASSRQPDWLLVDGLKGGSGIALDWRSLEVPVNSAHRGWLLAGGLNAGNVAEAAAIVRPSGVDVSSGVAGPDGMAKDPAQVRAFVAAAKGQRHAPV
jgi:phosphoribosylanthranilate isomerase